MQAKIRRKKIALAPKNVIDRDSAVSLREFRKAKVTALLTPSSLSCDRFTERQGDPKEILKFSAAPGQS